MPKRSKQTNPAVSELAPKRRKLQVHGRSIMDLKQSLNERLHVMREELDKKYDELVLRLETKYHACMDKINELEQNADSDVDMEWNGKEQIETHSHQRANNDAVMMTDEVTLEKEMPGCSQKYNVPHVTVSGVDDTDDVNEKNDKNETQDLEAVTTKRASRGKTAKATKAKKKKKAVYKCQYCSYKTSKKLHMQTHEMRHRGEKPWKCSHCQYEAVTKHEVTKHENNMHAD
eukprot:CAMPEP_0202694668 /NCGR_PEP_ID=MMETSP1385-20130828/8474_1 /ASSEMBLY_ACC=CAM_ASM_000861 /TAXON_ID=933848 /ORGANISM="Elphidium margaritaceum" /LENGTH=230 /DNA_ID=CAMNT_0049350557 /DNA_START=24 /DNA_END=716 /DNA_ORIENTATION=+